MFVIEAANFQFAASTAQPMTSFYPGPSKLYPQIEGYLQDAFKTGILSMNHRSTVFMDLMKETIELMKQKLNIPQNYGIYFTSSATENWEIVAQSLTQNHSEHHYNGAFGKKWFSYTSKIVPQTSASLFQIEHTLDYDLFQLEKNENRAEFNKKRLAEAEIICLVQNETSNGTQIGDETLQQMRRHSNALIALDVTSSLGGIDLNWALGDVWLASVQKCLGLPSGMGILICSEKAIARAEQIGDRSRYNSLLFIHDNFQKYQTHYTPNILNIYLLMRVMQQVSNIEVINQQTKKRAEDWYDFIEKKTDWNPLIKNHGVRSDTVLAIEGSVEKIEQIKTLATENNLVLGNGYGEWRHNTFRIANFPAIEMSEIEKLKNVLQNSKT